MKIDPKGPENGSSRVICGGGWSREARSLRSAKRYCVYPGVRYGDLGLRLVRTLGAGSLESLGSKQSVSKRADFQFVSLCPCTFTMGSPESDPYRNNDETQYEVSLTKEFQIKTTQVTQSLWQEVMGNNPSFFSGNPDNPVEMVSWHDCQDFISKLNERKDGFIYRLPTEAEWQYACADSKPGWCYENSKRQTHPVAQKEPNKFGLYDMLGNVWEWCQDWYGPYEDVEKDDGCGVKDCECSCHE